MKEFAVLLIIGGAIYAIVRIGIFCGARYIDSKLQFPPTDSDTALTSNSRKDAT